MVEENQRRAIRWYRDEDDELWKVDKAAGGVLLEMPDGSYGKAQVFSLAVEQFGLKPVDVVEARVLDLFEGLKSVGEIKHEPSGARLFRRIRGDVITIVRMAIATEEQPAIQNGDGKGDE